MIAVRMLVLGALLLASPAFAEGWRVESVSGDAVSMKGSADPEPLSVGDIVNEGSTLVSGPMTSVQVSRRGDVVSLSSQTIVELQPGGGGAHANVIAKSGDVDITSVDSAEGPLAVRTKFFGVEAGAAQFTVRARKDFANIDVDSGDVQVNDPRHAGQPVTVSAGGTYDGQTAAKTEDPKAKEKLEAQKKAEADAEAEKQAKELEKQGFKNGKGKKQSALAAKLAKHAAGDAKDGLDQLGDEYDANAAAPEAPKIGLLRFLFGPEAPSLSIILGALCVVFLGLGYSTSSVLGAAGFGMFGNGAILAVGALVGAGFHDLVFSPAIFWQYEPAPGVMTTVIVALAALLGLCFARKHYTERALEQATAMPVSATPAAKRAAIGTRKARFGG